ncbi:MAG: HAD family hydrolase [Candidatus Bipolaricaulaceae bacterium]
MIRAILLDLGGPVFNEDAEYRAWTGFLLQELHKRGVPVSQAEFATVLQEEIARCEPNPWLAVIWRFVRPNLEKFKEIVAVFRARNEEFQRELPGVFVRPEAKEAIPKLAEQYLLALAANQPPKALELLDGNGLLRYFRWSEVSGTMMVAKPRALFFRMILDALGVQAQEAVMVGDRLDHDIFPARLLGLYTVRVLLGPYKQQAPVSPHHEPHLCVPDLSQLPKAMATLVSQSR